MPRFCKPGPVGRAPTLCLLFVAIGLLLSAVGEPATDGVRVLGPGEAEGTFLVEVNGSVTCGGRPVAGVLLRLARMAGDVLASTRTDVAGRYSFRVDASPGFYRAVALAPPGEASPYPGSAQCAFRLLAGGAIGGKPRTSMHVLVPIEPDSPRDKDAVPAQGAELSWPPVEGAVLYSVTLIPMPPVSGVDAASAEPASYRTAAPRLELREELHRGWRYVWEVEARGQDGLIGRGAGEFHVAAEQGDATAARGALPRVAPAGPSLRVATYNVNWGLPAAEETLAALESMRADIVCVQETNPAWERLMRSRLRRAYPVMWFRPHDLPAGGMAVLSRWPIHGLQVLPSESGWFDAARFVADTPLGGVQVLSLHLQPVTISYEGFSLQAWLASAGARRAEAERYAAGLAEDMPTVVAGDLNEGDGGLAVTWLKLQGFSNALPGFEPGVPTWQWPVGSMTVRLQIDHVLYSDELDCVSAQVLEAGGSDHYPVLATLSRN